MRPARDYRSISLWFDQVDDDLTPRPPLGSDADADVAVVGAGYTGLWTAYYLARADPGLRIAIVEQEIAGFGASGRNGGWASALFAASHERVARSHGRDAGIALHRAMNATVDEVGDVARSEGIDAQWHKGGTLTLATSGPQLERVRGIVAEERAWGSEYTWLEPEAVRERVVVPHTPGAAFTPHCATVQPAALARGLARAVERRGVAIYEQTPALDFGSGFVRTPAGSLRAEVVVRATEGYTARLPRRRRLLAPVYSLMIATEPLPPGFWSEVGWAGRETITDGRHLLIYAQRTADDRIAFGGRGAPYHFGSRIRDSYDREPGVFAELRRALGALFPGARSAAITHEWGGPLGVPRDWYSSVGYDRPTGLAWAGGYVGDGVSTSNLAGRTLTDLILDRDTELVRLPWVGHRSRPWEPEPLRWIGANLALRTMASADRAEARTGKPARRAALASKLIGIE